MLQASGQRPIRDDDCSHKNNITMENIDNHNFWGFHAGFRRIQQVTDSTVMTFSVPGIYDKGLNVALVVWDATSKLTLPDRQACYQNIWYPMVSYGDFLKMMMPLNHPF